MVTQERMVRDMTSFKGYKITIKTKKNTVKSFFKEYWEVEEFLNMFKNRLSVNIETVYERNENI